MANSQNTFNKKEMEKNRLKKRLDKQKKREARKSNSQGGGLDNMLAYVNEFGTIIDTPPDPSKKIKTDVNSIQISIPQREVKETKAVRDGIVEFFNDSKGFGFIKETDTQDKYFVHIKGLTETIKENDRVTFEVERGPKGMIAVRVKKV